MKKIFVIIGIALLLFSFKPVSNVSAEEVVNEQEILDNVESVLGNYLDQTTVSQIITWVGYGLELIALLGIAIKYGRYKKTNTEAVIDAVKKEGGEAVKTELKKSKEEIDRIVDSVKELTLSTETIMKVLVLMQDNSTKGKAALIDYLGSKTKSEEVKESIEEVGLVLESTQKTQEQVLESVKDDYKEIF